MPSALLASMPHPFGQLIPPIFSGSSAPITHSSSPRQLLSSSTILPTAPCAGCGQPPQLCRLFPARSQLIGCAAEYSGTASAPDQPGSTAPSLQIIPAKAQPIGCALLPLSSVAFPILSQIASALSHIPGTLPRISPELSQVIL